MTLFCQLPTHTGIVCSLALSTKSVGVEDNDQRIYMGTSGNSILFGSALHATEFLVLFEVSERINILECVYILLGFYFSKGHTLGLRGLASDPKELNFYTSAIDCKICKWSQRMLIWKSTLKVDNDEASNC